MSRIVTVKTLSGKKGKLRTDECISLEERYPNRSCREFLHWAPNNRLFKEYRYEKAIWRSWCYEIDVESAVWWLIQEEQEIPSKYEHLDDRIDVLEEEPTEKQPIIKNYCLNCIRQSRTKWDRPTGEYERAILVLLR
jgi:hypothetical protein